MLTDADEIITRNSGTVLAMLQTFVHRDSLLSIHQYNPHEEISVTVISYMSLYNVSEKENGGVWEVLSQNTQKASLHIESLHSST
jgi:hypothetical protein